MAENWLLLSGQFLCVGVELSFHVDTLQKDRKGQSCSNIDTIDMLRERERERETGRKRERQRESETVRFMLFWCRYESSCV